jgi:hypothetical protein
MSTKNNQIKPNPTLTAIKRTKWPTSAEMDDLIDEFCSKFSQAYLDAFDEKMEDVDIEEFTLIIQQKLAEINGVQT